MSFDLARYHQCRTDLAGLPPTDVVPDGWTVLAADVHGVGTDTGPAWSYQAAKDPGVRPGNGQITGAALDAFTNLAADLAWALDTIDMLQATLVDANSAQIADRQQIDGLRTLASKQFHAYPDSEPPDEIMPEAAVAGMAGEIVSGDVPVADPPSVPVDVLNLDTPPAGVYPPAGIQQSWDTPDHMPGTPAVDGTFAAAPGVSGPAGVLPVDAGSSMSDELPAPRGEIHSGHEPATGPVVTGG